MGEKNIGTGRKPRSGEPTRRTRRREPRRATPAYLERAALFHIDRYATSVANLRRILLRKVERSAQVHGTDLQEGTATVDALLKRLEERGLIDDESYARSKVRAWIRRGVSRQGVIARLSARGVGEPVIAAALGEIAGEVTDPELAAALAFARRRRLGPFRTAEMRAHHRQRDLAALARQGFAFDLTLRVIDCRDPDELLAEAAGEAQ